jgi:hypothetical protein
LAPFLTAVMTQYVFADDLAVGKSTAIVTGGAAVLATILLAWGRPAFRKAIVERRHV